MLKKKNKKRFTKNCKAGLTPDMWVLLQQIKVRTGKSKAAIIREAIEEYDKTH